MRFRDRIFVFSILLMINTIALSQNKSIPSGFCVSKKSFELFNLINDIRKENNLDALPLSASLSFTAESHINDLIENHPDTSLCNLHSWSDKGKWTPCCYQPYIPVQECMWNKPMEITPYQFRGYELAFWQNDTLNPQQILSTWLDIPEARNMILNTGKWQNRWQAIGVSQKGNYALVWFGRGKDKLPKPIICGLSDSEKVQTNPNLIEQKTNLYYIIFGSYNKLKDAEKQLARYQKGKFKGAKILVNDGNYRIGLASFENLEEAKTAKAELDERYKEAWIVKF